MKNIMTPQSIVIGAVMVISSWVGSYFLNAPAKTEEAIADVKKEQSLTNERVSKVEEAIGTIKSSQMETRNDIKELLKRTIK
jgi:peptidoglycan hydrolase CwlO-like protein